jgi:hypothetical protein
MDGISARSLSTSDLQPNDLYRIGSSNVPANAAVGLEEINNQILQLQEALDSKVSNPTTLQKKLLSKAKILLPYLEKQQKLLLAARDSVYNQTISMLKTFSEANGPAFSGFARQGS